MCIWTQNAVQVTQEQRWWEQPAGLCHKCWGPHSGCLLLVGNWCHRSCCAQIQGSSKHLRWPVTPQAPPWAGTWKNSKTSARHPRQTGNGSWSPALLADACSCNSKYFPDKWNCYCSACFTGITWKQERIQVLRNYFKANATCSVVISFPAIHPQGQINGSPGRATPQVQPVLLALP